MDSETIKAFQEQLNKLHNGIVQTICKGKARCYSNLDRIEFEPGTVEKLNELLAKRNGLLELMDQLCQK